MILFAVCNFLVDFADQIKVALKAWDKFLYDDRLVGSLLNKD